VNGVTAEVASSGTREPLKRGRKYASGGIVGGGWCVEVTGRMLAEKSLGAA